jgi:hypothetical protein
MLKPIGMSKGCQKEKTYAAITQFRLARFAR